MTRGWSGAGERRAAGVPGRWSGSGRVRRRYRKACRRWLAVLAASGLGGWDRLVADRADRGWDSETMPTVASWIAGRGRQGRCVKRDQDADRRLLLRETSSVVSSCSRWGSPRGLPRSTPAHVDAAAGLPEPGGFRTAEVAWCLAGGGPAAARQAGAATSAGPPRRARSRFPSRARCSPSGCRAGWRRRSGSMPARSGRTISARSSRRRWRNFSPGRHRNRSRAGERPQVEAVFVFDRTGPRFVSGLRHIGAQRRARTGRAGQEGQADDEAAAMDARVLQQRQAKDHTIGSRAAALRDHAATSRARPSPRSGSSATSTRAPRWCARHGRHCATWPPRAASTRCRSTPRSGWPASSPTRRC